MFILQVEALLMSSIAMFGTAESSGQAPVFFDPSSPKSKSISENADSSVSIFVVIGTDNEGDTLTYAIHSQSPSTPSFTIVGSSGNLFPPAGLDAETTTIFTLEFSTTDGTTTVISPTYTVNIQDVNEFPPAFNQSSYTATIYDTAANGDLVLTLYASDQDVTASLSYSILVGDLTSTFSVGPSSSDVTVATSSNLNPATTPTFTLTVEVSDGSTSIAATVIITVLDDPCSPNPCQNSGTCDSSGTTYTCTCQSGWIDANCSTVDLCASTPCANGATCNLDVAGSSYTCSCDVGWMGTLCDIDDPCLPNPCENSGTCIVSGTTYMCQCTAAFSGINCTEGEEEEDDGGLSAGVIAALVVSSVLIAVVSLVVVTLYIKWSVTREKRKIKSDLQKADHYKMNKSQSFLRNSAVTPITHEKITIQTEADHKNDKHVTAVERLKDTPNRKLTKMKTKG